MISLLFSDLDGTLKREGQDVDAELQARLRDLPAQGVRLVVATGRMFSSAAPIVRPFCGDQDLIITYNGAETRRLADGKRIAHHPLSPEDAGRAFDVCSAMAIHVQAYVDDTLLAVQDHPLLRVYAERSRVPYRLAEKDACCASPTKLLAIEPDEAVMAKLEARLAADGLNVYRSRRDYLEIVAEGVDKGAAARDVLAYLGLQRSEAAASGDEDNDVPLLREAALAFGLGEGTPGLRAAANVMLMPPPEGMMEVLRRITRPHGASAAGEASDGSNV